VLDTDLEAKVLDDLKMLRKSRNGVTVQGMAEAATICRLLGNGDPYIAYTRLQHALLDATSDRTIRAAAASLGFSSDGASHLDRLEDAGTDLGGIDQRQARRLSDRGMLVLAKLISTNMTFEAVPELTASVAGNPWEHVAMFTSSRPLLVEMGMPEVELLVGERREAIVDTWHAEVRDEVEIATWGPIRAKRTELETSLTVVWRGEIWPKFMVRWVADPSGADCEMLGNKLRIHLPPLSRLDDGRTH
jgi:hypothetical protein